MADRPYIIVALGDSTTAGTPGFRSPLEAPPEGAGNIESQYAYWLQRTHENWRVLNRGINGQRAGEIRARFTRDVIEADPDVVVVIAGVNDIYQGRAASEVITELKAIFHLARRSGSSGIPLVAGTILPYNTATAEQNERMRAVNEWIRNYAAAGPDVTFCDTRGAVAAPGKPDRLAATTDDLHPSPDGYRLMALALGPAIKRALLR
jgi:lysophospholipase L1-like esterase